MKTNKCNFVKFMLSLSLLTGLAYAQTNDEQYLNSDPININGYVQPEVEATDQELEQVRGQVNFAKKQSQLNKAKTKNYQKLVDETEKLSETSEEMIEERKQAQKEMVQYQKKIDCLMGRESGRECDKYVKRTQEDEVKVSHAAPAPAPAVVEAKVEEKKSGDKFGETIKVLPYAGLTNFISDNENLEANISAGIRVESNASKRFSVGMGFKYTTMTTNDFADSDYNSYYGGYGDFYGSGREIEYKNMNFDIYTKFYLLKNERFRPYVGGGLGYNRSTLEYSNNDSPQGGFGFNNYNYGGEEVTTSAINAELMVGSEVVFSDTIGMVLEFNYTRGLGGNITSESANFSNGGYAPDQARLEELSNELLEANVLSLFAGLMVSF